MHYEIEVKFDDVCASVSDRVRYFGIMDKYKATGIGHEKKGTSTLFIDSEKPLNLEQIAAEFGDIKILSVHKN